MTCQTKSKATEHSHPETNPEMSTVHTEAGQTVMCLAHAAKAESQGHTVRIILT